MSRWLINAPAKINLFLHIVGKSAAGYHILESLFGFIRLFDILEVDIGSNRRGVKFVKFSGISRRDNTVQRAIGHLVRRCAPGVARNVYVRVTKNIPVSAGLAGGSADAAAIIRLLGENWGISEAGMRSVASSVGSDVPVCLQSKTAFVRGVGDSIHLLPDARLPRYVVLVKPSGVRLSTRSVFDAYSPGKFSESIKDVPKTADGWLSLIMKSRNDLTETAVSLVPEIQDILGVLQSLKGCCLSRMSGSGATCFALFEDGDMANAGVQHLKGLYPKWWVYGTEIVQ
ncbi:4-(cytidine 5'-diphospho)-2-C-methyl-D-erythritol kinase [Anaplasma capra]|uniref:4-(cytidine 5'-diphospho)-2-C-methyl-D-erythritol kinase n=1 Tax=Anaplasma capra TaxID=1562740 RepID=UPI0021D57858|nr:4-(cytidine 5'-diphospho)-2-C-methyl-D-erythritol kinase [Anaplasma capra]MCU7611482.1 4-(cytidine 5'-diphospho)-2-C-methyl-D-erythritol kinase [Anaplasma capra]MCU7612079.1 4-(cytidine 5'-diphospho)-2-C-methyl-D-erythritol kinase [Anaplasma capra]